MGVSAQQIRSESHAQVGEVIQRDAPVLIERWSRRAVEEQPHARRVHHEVLVDHLSTFLWEMGRSLAETDEDNNGWHCPPALEHGGQRWENGWSLAEVVRDYQILRLVIVEHVEKALDRPLGSREVMAIGLVLDEAIALSVRRFAQHQEEAARRAERERVEAEKREDEQRHRREAEALKEAERRKDEFLAILGHELRTPLASLHNALHVLRTRGADPAAFAQAEDVAGRQISQLTRLVDDLLDVSRVGRDKIVLQRQRLDLAALVGTLAEDHRRSLEEAGLRLTVERPDGPLWVRADPDRLAQVVGNLLNNAAKFTDAGGSVAVRVAPSADGRHAEVAVRDSGIGIPGEALPRIFEMFVQWGRHPQQRRGGLGIGLTLVRTLVQLHEGNVEAHSEGPGHGSTFTVRLPLAPDSPETPTDESPSSAQAPDAATRGRRILVVDDNADAAETLAMVLRLAGDEVRTAHDGASALDVAAAFVPEVVLLDLAMPRMDGYEVARRLRALPQLTHVVLIAQTGWSQEEEQARTRAAGFDHHLVKPVDPQALQSLLASLKIPPP